MKIEQLIKPLTLYNGRNPVTQKERNQFMSFIQKLKSTRKARFIYRGNSNVIEDYGTDIDDMPLLAEYLFCIGDKGRYFYDKKFQTINEIFSFIWHRFHNKVCRLLFSSTETKELVSRFLEKNPELCQYFSDEHNKHEFENKSLLPIEKAIIVADYYSSLLHTIGKSGFDKSYFLSSSTEHSVADEFKGENAIIIFGWLPRKGIDEQVDFNPTETHEKQREIVKTLNLPVERFCFPVKRMCLPVYNGSIHPEQKEISLKCGILPHYIIGFQHKNDFYINPNTLKEWNDSVVFDGLDIDQKDFCKYFNSTKLEQSYICCEGLYYIISKNDIAQI